MPLPHVHQRTRNIRSDFYRPALWVATFAYILLVYAVTMLLGTQWALTVVEENRYGFLSYYFLDIGPGFSNAESYILRSRIVWDIFYIQQLLAIFLSLALWHKDRSISLGLLTGVSLLFVLVLCGWLLAQAATKS